ncbi:hypothetical protein Bpfe_026359 [Biomphalaria pfeifferi]|uniref:TIR domain-containing protein n=1 Tax=Biomphalaria pfeifferi TaxID=112525 RepID=A0AAD8EY32_BIOPF|nr:hypothetical protein Bpfe_026359 [Biomphalaria pfeifferi]
MCRSNYETDQFKIFRNFVNNRNGKKNRVEIVYPVTHNLLPIFSNPWTSTQTDSFTGTQADAFTENSCLGTDSSAQGCGVFSQLFKSSTESLFFYEHVLLIVSIASVAFSLISIGCVVRQRCVRPLLSAILYFNKTETTFEAANGIPVKKLQSWRRRRRENRMKSETQDPSYQMYLSYDGENEFDSMIAEHLKGTLLSMNISVFDPYKDVQCGHLFLTEEANAVMNRQRFLVIASESYIAHKGIQFDFIQAAIVGQRSRLKDRLLIIKSEECDIDTLYQVP